MSATNFHFAPSKERNGASLGTILFDLLDDRGTVSTSRDATIAITRSKQIGMTFAVIAEQFIIKKLRLHDRKIHLERVTVFMGLRVSNLRIVLLLILASLHGCRSSAGPAEDVVPVSGIVLFDGKAVEGISVIFVPMGNNTAHTGFGTTDSEGQFVMFNYQQKEGLPVGEYVATFSFFRMADGSVPPKDKPPISSGAAELIPPAWSRATVAGSTLPGSLGPIAAKKQSKAEKPNAANYVKVPQDGITNLKFNIPKR